MDYNKFQHIEVPEEVDLVIEKAIKRGKNRYRNNFIKISGSLVACLALVLFLGVTSPVFAEFINNPTVAVRDFFSNFKDKGVDNAVKNGFVQKIDTNKKDISKSVTDKGLIITINQFAISGNELLLGFTIKADSSYKNWDKIDFNSFQISDDKGHRLLEMNISDFNTYRHGYGYEYGEVYYKNLDNGSFKISQMKQGIFEFRSNNKTISQIPNNITIKFMSFSSNPILSYTYNRMNFFQKLFHEAPKIVSGNWTFNIEVADKFKTAKTIEYVKSNETNENNSVKIDHININVTNANAKIYTSVDMKIHKMYLEDADGKQYNDNGGESGDTTLYGVKVKQNEPYFESPYFNNITKLYLVIESKVNGEEKDFKIELKKI